MFLDDYFDYQEKYSKKLGDKTIVLMQNGTFYEMHSYNLPDNKQNFENLNRVVDICNIVLTLKDKKKDMSLANPHMAGIPVAHFEKYTKILTSNNYSIVLVEQITPPPTPERGVTRIISPGTDVNFLDSNANYLMCIYIENECNISAGISAIDLSTGKNTVYEIISKKDDNAIVLDEIYRCIKTHNPSELVIYCTDNELERDYLISYLEIEHRIIHFHRELPSNYKNVSYQKQFLSKIFKNTGMLDPISYIDLEMKHIARISYLIVLDFAYDHNELIINKIEKPTIWESDNHLVLTLDSIIQLNLISPSSRFSNKDSLFSIINNTSTAVGRRLLMNRICNPINNIEEINKRYDLVESAIKDDLYKSIKKDLSHVIDIERLHKQIYLKTLDPNRFLSLETAYTIINDVIDILSDNEDFKQIIPSNETIKHFNEFINDYQQTFNLEKVYGMRISSMSDNFFNEGVDETIDKLNHEINDCEELFELLSIKLSNYIEPNSNYVKIHSKNKGNYVLSLTKKRGQILKERLLNLGKIKLDLTSGSIKIKSSSIKIVNHNKNTSKIQLELLSDASKKLDSYKIELEHILKKKYIEYLTYYCDTYSETLRKITSFLGEIDFIASCAKTSIMFKYTRPIIDEDVDTSYVDIKSLRHPIIERIQNDVEYVPNDIILGKETHGMLLFGTNASGKSSLMKAVGLNIIMAQAGMFISADSMIYHPYDYLFTRIHNNDNIFKGQSSFAVEMGELRSILKRSHSKSIVLGDELCSGTESISARSIFATSVVKLANAHTNFMFATHLHELCDLDIIKKLENVKSYHLKVIFDNENKILIYDRKMEEGNGETIYGIEVCRGLGFEHSFITMANDIRKDILNIDSSILPNKPSHFNANVYVDYCEICRREGIHQKGEDVHHIKFQCRADDNDLIGFIHKNNKSNLVVLCKSCHDRVHNKDIHINGYVQTTGGVELDYKILNKQELKQKKKNRKKYNEKQIELILSMKDKHSKKNICFLLKKHHNIKISVSTLNKIYNNKY